MLGALAKERKLVASSNPANGSAFTTPSARIPPLTGKRRARLTGVGDLWVPTGPTATRRYQFEYEEEFGGMIR
jgi:hypothetical protein